jgi:hypothetical protein
VSDGDLPNAVGAPRWSALGRFAFRFVFAYLVFYNFPQPLEYVPFFGEDAYAWIDQGWRWLVPKFGKLAFGVEITVFPAGSGDTTYNYVQLVLFVGLALIAAIVWTLLDRERENYATLHAGLRVYIRYVLAFAMISYGTAKVIQSQFPPADVATLSETYGEASPMGLLWTFMGHSAAYNAFIGVAETACGVLLWYRRTTLCGAILTAIVMLNVFVLDMCFDVPAKIYSAHLDLMALWLLAPDVRRIFGVAWLHRAAEPVVIRPMFTRPRAQLAWVAVKTLLLAGYTAWPAVGNLQEHDKMEHARNAPLAGLYVVDQFAMDGELRPPLTTDAARWRDVLIGENPYRGGYYVSVQAMDETRSGYRATLDATGSALTLTAPPQGGPSSPPSTDGQLAADPGVLTVKPTDDGRWKLAGTINGHAIEAVAKRKSRDDFPLLQRGFHWINEFPYNR